MMRISTADRSPPIVMSSPCTVATMSSPLMHPRHTHGMRSPSSILFPILCGVTCAVRAVLQRAARVFVTWLVIFGRHFDKHPSSCRSVEVPPPHVDQRHDFSSTLARGATAPFSAPSSRSSHPPLLSFPHAEQPLLILMHEFPHLGFHETPTLCSQHFHG